MTFRRVVFGVGAALAVVAGLCVGDVASHPVSRTIGLQRAILARSLPRVEAARPAGPLVGFDEGGEGPVVLFLHGFGDQGGTWWRVAPKLTDLGRVVVLDLPGHGESAGADDLDVAQIVDGVVAALDATSPGAPAVLVGNSLGGWLAMRVAIDHPDRVSRVVLVNSAGLHQPVSADSLLPTTREQARAKLEEMGGLPGGLSLWGAGLDELVAGTSHPRFRSLYESMHGRALDDVVADLEAPADLVWGPNDVWFDLNYARRLEAALPSARLTTLPAHCGHVPQLQCPGALVDTLRATLSGPAPTPSWSVDDFAWFEGCWRTTDGFATECWRRDGDRLTGVTTANDGSVLETIRLEPRGDVVAYVAAPTGQVETAFPLFRGGRQRVVFHNPDHDFPRDIGYYREGERLVAVLSGTGPMGERRLQIEMDRVE
jgi:pimeloyl-ACP methyl ester carboxylesterase